MAIPFKKPIAKLGKVSFVSPEEPISNASMKKAEAEYRKSDHFKHLKKKK